MQEEVYTDQPHDFADSNTTLIYKLKKVICGLNQIPWAWHDKLHHTPIQFGFVSSKCDHSLFVYKHQGVTLYALVYVNDMLITGTSPILIHDLITKLHAKFSLKKLDIPKYFLGIEVHYHKNGSILLTQSKYIKDLLNKVNMSGVNWVKTPTFSHCKLKKHGSDVQPDPYMHMSIVGVKL